MGRACRGRHLVSGAGQSFSTSGGDVKGFLTAHEVLVENRTDGRLRRTGTVNLVDEKAHPCAEVCELSR